MWERLSTGYSCEYQAACATSRPHDFFFDLHDLHDLHDNLLDLQDRKTCTTCKTIFPTRKFDIFL
jgi:hypothetical protein